MAPYAEKYMAYTALSEIDLMLFNSLANFCDKYIIIHHDAV